MDFFHQLQGFLACRSTIRKKWSEISHGQIESQPSFSLVEPQPDSFQVEYQQQNLSGDVVQSIQQLYETASYAKSLFDSVIISSVERSNVSIEFLKLAPLKRMERALEKAKDDYLDRSPGPPVSWLFDIVRGTVLCNNEEEILSILSILLSQTHNDVFRVIRLKNRFLSPTPGGFRDINMNLQVTIDVDGKKIHHICELQIHCLPILTLSDALHSHHYYEYFRTYFRGNLSVINSRLQLMETLLSYLPDSSISMSIDTIDPSHDSHPSLQESSILQSKVFGLEELVERIASLENLQYMEDLLELLELSCQYKHALDLLSRITDQYPSGSSKQIHCLVRKGTLLQTSSQYSEALSHYLGLKDLVQELEKNECLDDEMRSIQLDFINNLAVVQMKLGNISESKENFLLSLHGYESMFGPESKKVCDTRINLSSISGMQENNKEALEWIDSAEVSYRVLVDTLSEDYLGLLNNKATCLKRVGRMEEALDLYRKVLESRERVLGLDHVDCLKSAYNLGLLYADLGRFDEAEELINRSVLSFRSVLGPLSDDYLASIHLYGRFLFFKKRIPEARAAFTESREGCLQLLGPSHVRSIFPLGELALLSAFERDGDSAVSLISECVDQLLLSVGEDHPGTEFYLKESLSIFNQFDRIKEGKKYFDLKFSLFKKKNIESRVHSMIAFNQNKNMEIDQPLLSSYLLLAKYLQIIGKYDFDHHRLNEALESYSRARDMYSLLGGAKLLNEESLFDQANLLFDLGRVSAALGDLPSAEAYYSDSLEAFQSLRSTSIPASPSPPIQVNHSTEEDTPQDQEEQEREETDPDENDIALRPSLMRMIGDCHNQLATLLINQQSTDLRGMYSHLMIATNYLSRLSLISLSPNILLPYLSAKFNFALFYNRFNIFILATSSCLSLLHDKHLELIPPLNGQCLSLLLNSLENWEANLSRNREDDGMAFSLEGDSGICAHNHQMTIPSYLSLPYLSFSCDTCHSSSEGQRWICTECSEDRCFQCTPPTKSFYSQSIQSTYYSLFEAHSPGFSDSPSLPVLSEKLRFAECLMRRKMSEEDASQYLLLVINTLQRLSSPSDETPLTDEERSLSFSLLTAARDLYAQIPPSN